MELGKHVVDKAILDTNGRRCGMVDDLLLEMPPPRPGQPWEQPEVAAIVSGPLALARTWPRWVQWLARRLYGLLGVADPQPAEVPWSHVAAIDVVVHLDVDRDDAGLTRLEGAVARRYIERLPGA